MKELHAQTDAIVRARLAELPPAEPTTEGWEALERSLDAALDSSLQQALTGLSVGVPAAGWADLARKLDPRTPGELEIAEKLESLKPTAPADAWQALEARLNQVNSDAVDTIVSTGLQASGATPASGWPALAARLELIDWRRSTIAAWKITEGALLASLLLVFLRFGGAEEAPQTLPIAADATITPALVAAGTVVERQEGSEPTTTQEAPALLADALPVATTTTPTSKPVVNAPSSVVLSDRQAATAQPLPRPLPTEGARTRAEYLPEEVAPLAVKPLTRSLIVPSPMVALTPLAKHDAVNYYINTFVSPLDFNQVVTPGNSLSELEVKDGKRITNGLSAGFLLDIGKGKHALQTGIIISQRSYTPTKLAWKSNDVTLQGYEQFRYTALEFPFSYQRILRESSRWRLSGRLGVSMNVVAASKFVGEEKVAESFERFHEQNPVVPFAPLMPPRLSEQEKSRQLARPDRGWLEGGSLLANSSFYVGGGFMLERIVGPRWSLYVSPSFGRVIYLDAEQGIGPTNDRIHSGSLRFGSRYLFNAIK